MKILHIITALSVGGAQSILHQLLRAWKNDQDEHQVISLVGGGRLAEDIQALGIKVHELAMQPGKPYPGELWKLSRAIRAYKPDLIQTWLYHADLIGGIIARFSWKAPIVWGIHHSLSSTRTLKPSTFNVVRLNALFSWLIPSRINCCSKTALETHVRLGYQKSKMVIIPNGIDLARFCPDPSARLELRTELQLPDDAKIVGMFARFHPQKDHQNLIMAAGLLHRRFPDVHFVLSGQDVDNRNERLRQWILSDGIADNIHLLGLRHEMPRLHAALDIFTLSSSEGEALPLVLCEAMACGVPCVATDVGDASDIIANTGRCVPARNPAALAEAWGSILAMPAADYARLSELARTRVQTEYDLRNISRFYYDLYHAVIR